MKTRELFSHVFLCIISLLLMLLSACSRTDYYDLLSKRDVTTFYYSNEHNSVLIIPVESSIEDTTITGILPHGTLFPSTLTPSFEIEGYAFYVDGACQRSGENEQEFSADNAPLTYALYSYDGTKTEYQVAVRESNAYFKDYSFTNTLNDLDETVNAEIAGNGVWLYLSHESDLSALKPTFTLSSTSTGAAIDDVAQTSESGTVDLSSPLTYRIYSVDEYYSDYLVSTYRINSLSFSGEDNAFNGDYSAIIYDDEIVAALPQGTDLSSLVPTFDYNGKGVLINGEEAESGKGSYDFGSGSTLVVYTTGSSSHSYTLRLDNSGLICKAGTDRSTGIGICTLSGTAQSATEGDTLSYQWTIDAKAGDITLNASDTLTPNFAVTDSTVEGEYTFRLTVTNTAGDSVTDSVTITVDYGPQFKIKNLDTTVSGKISFDWMSSESDANYLEIVCKKNSDSTTSTHTSTTKVGTIITGLSDTEYNFSFTLYDSAGNASDTQVLTITVGTPTHLIYTAEDLYNVGGGSVGGRPAIYSNWLMGHNYIVMNDIDLQDDYPSDWTPIGEYGTNAFAGKFDGRGFTVSNLTMVKDSIGFNGFFGYIDGATIKNLSLLNVDIEYQASTSNSGILLGRAVNSSLVSNCHILSPGTFTFTGNSTSYLGGLGGAIEECTLDFCSVRIDLAFNNLTSDPVGGLIGFITSSSSFTISNCYVSGNVNDGLNDTGGLIGSISSSSGTIEKCYTTGNVSGTYNIGGLVGYIGSSSDVNITSCYATGNVDGDEQVGGLIGELITSDAQITKCYATGYIQADDFSGGFVGLITCTTGYTMTVKNCYSRGEVESSGTPAGGFIGKNETLMGPVATIAKCYTTGKITNAGNAFCGSSTVEDSCFYDSTICSSDTSGAIGKPTEDMQKQGTFTSILDAWDFTNIWNIDEGNGYPYLRGVGGQ